MSLETIQAIDVHAHFGKYCGAPFEIMNQWMSGSAEVVVQRACLAHTRLTMVSPLEALLPRLGGKPVLANTRAATVVAETEGLLQWVVVDPTQGQTRQQAEEMLNLPKCIGIKIHPEEHGYPIAEYGRALFEFASAHQGIIQSHSGEKNSLPADFVKLANDFPQVQLIISHLGCGWDGDLTHQVRAIQQSKHGNVYTDTSSAKSITSNLLEWAVKEIGAEHILYGTDSPLYFAPMQRARVWRAAISDRDKCLILRDNALRLFGRKLQREFSK
ncbi:MAG: amidohydrolase family protein [Verrucomicrobia bacterium]|nr:amidohydrolase family protein [Verrucomicrobiota bacterium]